MRIVEIANGFGLDQLAVAERPRPTPAPGQVLLRMRAASLNYRDLLTVQGKYNPRQPLPLIPCSDGAGEVVALGDGVSRVAIGDRVTTLFAQGWISGEPERARMCSTLGGPLDGTLCEYMTLDAEGVIHAPEHLTDEEAACLPCAGLTAWSALVDHASIKAGDTVLILGTGGVAIFALQFAILLGARTIVTSSSDEKLERARRLGAWETVNYRTTPEWGREAARRSGRDGVDLVIEVGGADTLPQSVAAVRPGGRIALIGVLSGVATKLDLTPVLMNQVRIQGVLVGHRDGFEAMNRAIAAHQMRPAVTRSFPFEEARSALECMAAGGHFGKIALRMS